MISSEMYSVLKEIPRWPQTTMMWNIQQAYPIDAKLLKDILKDAQYMHYIGPDIMPDGIIFSNLFLTESGKIELELYEKEEENKAINKKTLKVANDAKKVAIVGVIVSILALLPQLPEILFFAKTLFGSVK